MNKKWNWKIINKISVISAIILLISIISPGIITQKALAHEVVSFQIFYDRLSPYGDWVNSPQYGYAWIPNVAMGFVPYGSEGHWEYTEFGWSWVSDYPWGWAAFHYGRWIFDPVYGWMWIPGTEWGPAWVVWRHSTGYYGWAPMPPGFRITVGFGAAYGIPVDRWYFIRERDFWRPHINHYFVSRSRAYGIMRDSRIIENTYEDRDRHVRYIAGPNRNDVQRATGRSIRALQVTDYNKPGQVIKGNRLEIYRPEVQKSVGSAQPAPAKITDNKNITPLYDRINKNQPRGAANQSVGQTNTNNAPRSVRGSSINIPPQNGNAGRSQEKVQSNTNTRSISPSGKNGRVQSNNQGRYSQPSGKHSIPPASRGRVERRSNPPQSIGRSQPPSHNGGHGGRSSRR